MALAPNSVIVHNMAITFPSRKLGTVETYHRYNHSKPNFHSCSQSQQVSRIATASCLPSSTLSDVHLHSSNTSAVDAAANSWSAFARNVSGEWDGYGADFTGEGIPIELPESVVPEAYREWEVKVYDWQTLCPTLAEPKENVMFYKSIKLLPTVGCEADAATRYSIDEKHIGGPDNKVSAFAYDYRGCYIAVWPIKDDGTHKVLELEHCLTNLKDCESRVRIIQTVRVDGLKTILQNIRIFCEQWYGPFRNGDQLGGCAICDSGFASTAALEASEIIGVWQGPKFISSFNGSENNFLQELKDDGVLRSVRDECNLVLLPRQLWCYVEESEFGETCHEVGWLCDEGRAITSRCIFSNEVKLKEISIANQTKALEAA
ncbi:hypothetical protein SLE2022_142120 [Rubroshorea leprosula]